MSNNALYAKMASMIPSNIRKKIIAEQMIDKAVNTTEDMNSPMFYLFDVYEEFLDANKEFNNWYCHKCKTMILHNWKQIKPYLTDPKK